MIKRRILDEDTNSIVTVNSNKVGKEQFQNKHRYRVYFSCEKCKNASWYDDTYCNNGVFHYIDKENTKTTWVYCAKYEVE